MFAIFESGDYDDKEMFARYGMAWTRNKFSDGTSRHYYLRMRKYEYTYQGWYDHHCKPETKVNKLGLGTILGMNSIPEIEEAKRKTYCHYQYGTLPIDKKRKLDPEGKTKEIS